MRPMRILVKVRTKVRAKSSYPERCQVQKQGD